MLNVIGCLVPFLEYDLLDTLPSTVAGTLAVLPSNLQKDIIELLCTHLLPVTLGTFLCQYIFLINFYLVIIVCMCMLVTMFQQIPFSFITGYAGMNENPTYATDSTAAIIMMTFQYVENGGNS